jgi:hypothetical protein
MVRWQEEHVVSLAGFGEAPKAPEKENGAMGFDETRGRLGRGCFMNMNEGELDEATTQTTTQRDATKVQQQQMDDKN